MPKFDVFIPSVPKDYNKLIFAIEQVKENVVGFDGIYVSTPTEMPDEYKQNDVHYFVDKKTFDMGEYQFPWRHNWLYQMYLKLFQNITKNDWYMTIDSDVMILKQLDMFNGETPIQWLGRDQNHRPYFDFQEKLLGIGRVFNHSFINDMNLFNRDIIEAMVKSSGLSFGDFIKKSTEITDENCHPGEPEMYGNFVYKNYPNLYEYRHMSTNYSGRRQQNLTDQSWSNQEIQTIINNYKNTNYHMVMLHSWT